MKEKGCGECCKICGIHHSPSCSNNAPNNGLIPEREKDPDADAYAPSGSSFKLSDKMFKWDDADNGSFDFEDVKEFIRRLKEEFIEDWEFSKKAKAEPYIHFRRVIDRINKLAGKELI